MIFKASMDTPAKVVTVVITIVFAAIILVQFPSIEGESPALYITAILFITYGMAYLYRPLNYTLTEKDLLIKRPIGTVRIPRVSITAINPIERKKIRGAIRTFGVGGLFGYYGKFYTFSIGSMTWYMTNRNKALLLTTTSQRKILISPDERERFQTELHNNVSLSQ